MENASITKLGWGSEADIETLMYQEVPVPLRVSQPDGVVDVQLGFCKPNRRIGMQKVLESLPSVYLKQLPPKGEINFDGFHGRNRRIFSTPMEIVFATYAIDDLHRIEFILRCKIPA